MARQQGSVNLNGKFGEIDVAVRASRCGALPLWHDLLDLQTVALLAALTQPIEYLEDGHGLPAVNTQ